MDDGTKLAFPSDNAASAMFKALNAHPGHRIKQCHCGGSSVDRTTIGRTEYKIPEHNPISQQNVDSSILPP